MNDQLVFLLLALTSAGFLALFVGLFVYQLFKGLKTLKRAGGAQGLVSSWRAAAAALPPSRKYSIVAPTWKAETAWWVNLILFIVGLALITGGWLLQREHVRQVRLLQTEGVVATAQVTDKSISHGDDNDTYYVHYAFMTLVNDQRVEIKRKESVPAWFYDRTEDGGHLEIVYVGSAPSIVRIRALYTPGQVEYWRLLVPGGLGLCCWLLAWDFFRHYRNARQLDGEGITTTVRLLDCYKEESSDSISYYVAYELPGVGPIRHTVDKQLYTGLQAGDAVKLVYLPARPKIFRPQWGEPQGKESM